MSTTAVRTTVPTRAAFIAAVLSDYLSGKENAYEAFLNYGGEKPHYPKLETDNDILFVVRCLDTEYDTLIGVKDFMENPAPMYRDYFDRDCGGVTPLEYVRNFAPMILKGIGKINGDGYKDTTFVGQVVYVWNRELPPPYKPGQFRRIGFSSWSAGTDQYDFQPATYEEVHAFFEDVLAERMSLRHKVEGSDNWAYVKENAKRLDQD